jgi:hypothetical protein
LIGYSQATDTKPHFYATKRGFSYLVNDIVAQQSVVIEFPFLQSFMESNVNTIAELRKISHIG